MIARKQLHILIICYVDRSQRDQITKNKIQFVFENCYPFGSSADALQDILSCNIWGRAFGHFAPRAPRFLLFFLFLEAVFLLIWSSRAYGAHFMFLESLTL